MNKKMIPLRTVILFIVASSLLGYLVGTTTERKFWEGAKSQFEYMIKLNEASLIYSKLDRLTLNMNALEDLKENESEVISKESRANSILKLKKILHELESKLPTLTNPELREAAIYQINRAKEMINQFDS